MKQIVKKAFKRAKEVNVSSMSASVTLFLMFSIIPSLLILIQASILFGVDYEYIFEMASRYIPEEVYTFLNFAISNGTGLNGINTFIFFIVTFWGLSKVFVELIRSADNIYGVKKVKYKFYDRIKAIFVILIFFLIIFSYFLLILFGRIYNIGGIFQNKQFVDTLYYIISSVMMVVFPIISLAIIFKFITPVKITFKNSLQGALVTTLIWVIMSTVLSIYVRYFSNYSIMYGTFAVIIVFIYWLYFMSFSLIVGILVNYATNSKYSK